MSDFANRAELLGRVIITIVCGVLIAAALVFALKDISGDTNEAHHADYCRANPHSTIC